VFISGAKSGICHGGLIRRSGGGGQWGSGGEALSRRRLGVGGGKAPIRRKQGGLGADPPALGDFCNFSTKITHF